MATETELHWLAGLLEGEGTFDLVSEPKTHGTNPKKRGRIQFASSDEDVVERVAELFGVAYHPKGGKLAYPGSYTGRKQMWTAHVRGDRAVALMQELYLLMGDRRRQQINHVLEGHRTPA